MSTVSDACDLLKTMLTEEWVVASGGVLPTITLDWFTETPDPVVVDNRNKKVRFISLKELSTVNLPASEGLDEVESSIQVDVWAEDRADATEIREEIKRIMRAKASDPITGMCFGYLSDWTDTTAMDASDQLHRFTATLDLMYEEE